MLTESVLNDNLENIKGFEGENCLIIIFIFFVNP